MRALTASILKHWPGLAFIVSAAMIAGAHAFETFGHLPPCELCLHQREVYWIALPVTALAFAASRWRPLRTLAPWLGAVMALIFAGGTLLAGYHAGVEWHFWPGPEVCSGARTAVTAQALGELLRHATLEPPRCDTAAWRLLGLSLAGYNALISAALTGWSAAWALWVRKA